LKRIYRIPFDYLEEWSMSFADSIAVNSGFTKGIAGRAWPELVKRKNFQIVYPSVDVTEKQSENNEEGSVMWQDTRIILSINRFETKKDVGLAIKAFAGIGEHKRHGVRLVIAGGYDNRVPENVVYHKELVQLAESLGLKTATTRTVVTALVIPQDVDVLFLLSVPNTLKETLLGSAQLLVYTPSNEHFGIVPLEAMLAGVPVLAANTGGPLETVVDGETGWLRDPEDVESWTSVMSYVLHGMPKEDIKKMGLAARKRVTSEFSNVKMAERLDAIIEGMAETKRKSCPELASLAFTIVVMFSDWFYWRQQKTPGKKLGKQFLPPFTLTLISLASWGGYFVLARLARQKAQREALAREKGR